MAFLGSQSVGNLVSHDEIISIVGDISTIVEGLNFSVDTVNVKQIDLLEVRYRPDPTEIAANLDILSLEWKNFINTNNTGNWKISIFPSREADGTYRYEPNHPINFYINDCGKTHLSKRLTFRVKKSVNDTSLKTVTFLARFKVTKFMSTRLEYEERFKSTILNAMS